jgi:hypothetical protein
LPAWSLAERATFQFAKHSFNAFWQLSARHIKQLPFTGSWMHRDAPHSTWHGPELEQPQSITVK